MESFHCKAHFTNIFKSKRAFAKNFFCDAHQAHDTAGRRSLTMLTLLNIVFTIKFYSVQIAFGSPSALFIKFISLSDERWYGNLLIVRVCTIRQFDRGACQELEQNLQCRPRRFDSDDLIQMAWDVRAESAAGKISITRRRTSVRMPIWCLHAMKFMASWGTS